MADISITVARPSTDSAEVRIAGQVDASTAGQMMMAIVSVVLGEPPRSCLVDLTGVSAIDPAGLDALVRGRRYLGEHGVTMRTHNSWSVDRLFREVGLLDDFGAPRLDDETVFATPSPPRRGRFGLRRSTPLERSGAHWAR